MLIRNFLKNASKYRGTGIDIRSTCGCIVAPPSRRDGKNYTIINNTAPIYIPSSLISWLIVGKTPLVQEPKRKKVVTRRLTTKAFEYDLTEDQIKDILTKLPAKHLDIYSDWLALTTVLK